MWISDEDDKIDQYISLLFLSGREILKMYIENLIQHSQVSKMMGTLVQVQLYTFSSRMALYGSGGEVVFTH